MPSRLSMNCSLQAGLRTGMGPGGPGGVKATRQTPSAASKRNSFIFAWREPLSVSTRGLLRAKLLQQQGLSA
jgi:hypothetical protein